MKKILTTLCSLSMISFFNDSIISCSANNKVEDGLHEDPSNKSIDQFKNEVTTIVNDQIKKSSSNFNQLASKAWINNFLQYQKISKVQNNKLTDKQKSDLKIDVQYFLDYNAIEKKLQDLKNNVYYAPILANVKTVLKDLIFDFDTLKIIFPKDSDSVKTISVYCDYKFVVNYEIKPTIFKTFDVKNLMKYYQTNDSKISNNEKSKL